MPNKTYLHPHDLVLRCLAMQRGNYWVAMCVDLDLAVQADTQTQARSLLSAQMSSYVADAVGVDNAHAADLLRRKSPLRYRALYYMLRLVHTTRSHLSYEAAMPMVPAGA
jgi:hypothetical protein